MAASGGMWVKVGVGGGHAKTQFIMGYDAGKAIPKTHHGHHVFQKGTYFHKTSLPSDMPKADSRGLAYVSSAAHAQLAKMESKIRGNKYETGFVVDAAGRILAHKSGSKNTIYWYGPEKPLLEGAILTHNHPSGSSFSTADVHSAMTFHLREVRAVGMLGGKPVTYSMRRPAAGWKTVAKHKADVVNAAKAAGAEWDQANKSLILASPKAALAERQHAIWARVAAQFGFHYERIIGG